MQPPSPSLYRPSSTLTREQAPLGTSLSASEILLPPHLLASPFPRSHQLGPPGHLSVCLQILLPPHLLASPSPRSHQLEVRFYGESDLWRAHLECGEGEHHASSTMAKPMHQLEQGPLEQGKQGEHAERDFAPGRVSYSHMYRPSTHQSFYFYFYLLILFAQMY